MHVRPSARVPRSEDPVHRADQRPVDLIHHPSNITTTTELDVPRSIPMTLLTIRHHKREGSWSRSKYMK
jgi:hypothetical protein